MREEQLRKGRKTCKVAIEPSYQWTADICFSSDSLPSHQCRIAFTNRSLKPIGCEPGEIGCVYSADCHSRGQHSRIGPNCQPVAPQPGCYHQAGNPRRRPSDGNPSSVIGRNPTLISANVACFSPGAILNPSLSMSATPPAVTRKSNFAPVSRVAPMTTRESGKPSK